MLPFHIKGDDLPGRMNPGVRSPCPDNGGSLPGDSGDRAFDRPLNAGRALRLPLKPLVRRSIISEQGAVAGHR